MTPFETATAFFHACENLKGWEGCQQYATVNATFSAQSEPLAKITTLQEYTEWMKGFGDRFESDEIMKGKKLTKEKQRFLDEEEVKVKALRDKMNTSIENAEALLK